MKSVIRSIKNEINNYDEGERLVRELTSNERSPPSTQMLIKLKIMLTDQYQFPTVVRMLFKRLKDYNNIRHVEKGLICIEYLIKNADRKFVRYCQRDKGSISKLTRYRYILGNNNGVPVDYGGNIRKRAKRITDLLSSEDKLRASRAKAQGYSMKFKHPNKKQNKSPKSTNNHRQRAPKRTPTKSKSVPEASTPKKKKVKKKKKKKEGMKAESQPQYESFIDMPPPNNSSTPAQGTSGGGSGGSDDLFAGNWWQDEDTKTNSNTNTNTMVNNNSVGDDEFAWFEADPNADIDFNQSGVGDDGGAFGFGNDDEFNDEVKENIEEVDADTWMTSMTQMDNVLDGSIQKKDPNKKKHGVSMAQMAKSNPVKHIPNAFGTDDFFNQNAHADLVVKGSGDGNEFDPFGLGNQNNNQNNNAASNITSLYTSNKGNNDVFGGNSIKSKNNSNGGNNGFGYRAKVNMNPYSSDPFAGIGGGVGSAAGPTPAKYVPRKKQSDPFAQFGSMK